MAWIGPVVSGVVSLVGGAMARKSSKQPSPPPRINSFTSPIGRFNAGGGNPSFEFTGPKLQNTFTAPQADPATIGQARANVGGIVERGGQPTAERLNAFQDAYINEQMRRINPELERRTGELNARISAGGGGGNSANIFAQSLDAQNRSRTVADVGDRSIQAREDLLNNSIRNDLAQLNAFQQVGQQDYINQLTSAQYGQGIDQQNFLNSLNAQNSAGNLYTGNQNTAINYQGAVNAANQQALANIYGGASTGAILGDRIASAFQNRNTGTVPGNERQAGIFDSSYRP